MKNGIIKRTVCICLIALMLLPCTAFASECDTPYTETTYGIGPNALSSVSDDSIRAEIDEHLAKNDLTLISISTRSVYFRNEVLADGSINRVPMTKAEVSAYNASLNCDVAPCAITNPDPKENGKLTITLVVSADARHQVRIDTRADWDASTLYGDSKYQPAGDDDTYTITWGKTDYLKARSGSCTVKYRNGQTITPENTLSGEHGNYTWIFGERTPSGVDAEKIYSTVTLAPKTAYQGGTTWCEFTYVHTYVQKSGVTTAHLEWPLSITAEGLPY